MGQYYIKTVNYLGLMNQKQLSILIKQLQ